MLQKMEDIDCTILVALFKKTAYLPEPPPTSQRASLLFYYLFICLFYRNLPSAYTSQKSDTPLKPAMRTLVFLKQNVGNAIELQKESHSQK